MIDARARERVSGRFLPRRLYAQHHRYFPISCVDIVVTDGDFILLLLRAEQPLKGVWYLPGGRILKNEAAEAACHRVIARETGLCIDRPYFVEPREYFFRADPFGHGQGTHVTSWVYLARLDGPHVARLDRTSLRYTWENKYGILRDKTHHRDLRAILKAVIERQDRG